MRTDISISLDCVKRALMSITPEEIDMIRQGDPKVRKEALRLAKLGIKQSRRIENIISMTPGAESIKEIQRVHKRYAETVYKLHSLVTGVPRHD